MKSGRARGGGGGHGEVTRGPWGWWHGGWGWWHGGHGGGGGTGAGAGATRGPWGGVARGMGVVARGMGGVASGLRLPRGRGPGDSRVVPRELRVAPVAPVRAGGLQCVSGSGGGSEGWGQARGRPPQHRPSHGDRPPRPAPPEPTHAPASSAQQQRGDTGTRGRGPPGPSPSLLHQPPSPPRFCRLSVPHPRRGGPGAGGLRAALRGAEGAAR